MTAMTTGADLLCETLLAHDIDVCFANPGTSEMHFVAALDRQPRMRCVLGAFEGVVTGAADGWARMTDRPAATLLHLGPGLANGLANLHNARRARSRIVNIVGDHATDHLAYDAPLTSDIEALARPMSDHVRRIADASDVVPAATEAISLAGGAAGQVVTLILPADAAWTAAPAMPSMSARPLRRKPAAPSQAAVRKAADAVRRGQATTLLLGGMALRGQALVHAGRIAAHTGVRLLAETANARIERGRGRTPIARLPYPVDQARDVLRGTSLLLRIGARDPVAFFRYPEKPSLLAPPGCESLELAGPGDDLEQALAWLADELGCGQHGPGLAAPPPPELPAESSEGLSGRNISAVVAALMPENAILCDESITLGRDFSALSMGAAPHDHLQLTGGAIGQGLPLAVGAGIACPDRKVVGLQADGSALYTLQALWTQARESLDCLTVILANRSYATLHAEMRQVGIERPGPNAQRMLDLVEPAPDWVSLAQGLGVPAVRASDLSQFIRAFRAGCAQRGPFLIEALV